MGSGCSKVKTAFEEKVEWGSPDNDKYDKDPEDHYNQLNTDRDQRGETTVNHVYKKSRDVFGQPAIDIGLNPINWSEYGIEFRTRPSPYDFPAFEHLKEEVSHQPRLSADKQKNAEKVGLSKEQLSKPSNVGSAEPQPRSKVKSPEKKQPSMMKTVTESEEKKKKLKSEERKMKSDEKKARTKEEAPGKTTEEKDATKTKEQPAGKSKEGKAGKPTKRLSHNAEMDHCSLEDENA